MLFGKAVLRDKTGGVVGEEFDSHTLASLSAFPQHEIFVTRDSDLVVHCDFAKIALSVPLTPDTTSELVLQLTRDSLFTRLGMDLPLSQKLGISCLDEEEDLGKRTDGETDSPSSTEPTTLVDLVRSCSRNKLEKTGIRVHRHKPVELSTYTGAGTDQQYLVDLDWPLIPQLAKTTLCSNRHLVGVTVHFVDAKKALDIHDIKKDISVAQGSLEQLNWTDVTRISVNCPTIASYYIRSPTQAARFSMDIKLFPNNFLLPQLERMSSWMKKERLHLKEGPYCVDMQDNGQWQRVTADTVLRPPHKVTIH